jgi:hypothetical protein
VRGHHVSNAHLKQCFVDALIESIMAVGRTAVMLEAKRVVYSVAACVFICNIYVMSLFCITKPRIQSNDLMGPYFNMKIHHVVECLL